MKPLSATLLAALKAPSHRPYVKVEVVDRVGAVGRINWQRLYSGAEPDFHHALTLAGDGSLVRARMDPATLNIFYMRVPNPGPGANFSQWRLLSMGTSGLALVATGAQVYLFWGNGDSVYYCYSSDYGENFGSPTNMGAPEPFFPVGWLAAAAKSNGDLALFATVGGTVFTRTRTAGAWSDWQGWTNNLATITGIAACYYRDWNVALAGQDTQGSRGVWTCIYGDGYASPAGYWTSLQLLTVASSTSNIQFRCPSIAYPDVFRLFLVEKHSGLEAYVRPFWSYSLPGEDFSANLWREPIPFDLSAEYGVAIAPSGLWLSCPFGVWQGAFSQAAAEVTGDVAGLVAVAEPYSGRVRVELDNSSGKFNTIGSGPLEAVKEGSQLKVSLGYYTSAGAEVASPQVYWIEGWEYGRGPRGSFFILEGEDGWGWLASWKARRQFGWGAGEKTVGQLLAFFLARAGLKLTVLSQSSFASGHRPAFTLHPGASGEEAVRRLLERVEDRVFFRGEEGYLKYLNPQETVTYSYGTDHPLLSSRYASSSLSVNRVQVYGSGVMTELYSWEGVERVLDRLLQVHDLNLTTSAQAQQRGQAQRVAARRAATSQEIEVAPHPGQELYDVVDITDPPTGLNGAQRRVEGMELAFSPASARFSLRLRLSGV